MKKKLLMSLIILTTLAVSATVGAYAAVKMTLVVNGKLAKVDPINIKGVTYVPLRAAAELLGAEVKYDAATRTVRVDSKTQQEPPAPQQSEPDIGFARSKPAPIGTELVFTHNYVDYTYSGKMTLEQVVRGPEAYAMLLKTNPYNDPAPEGFEYLLAKINFQVVANTKPDATVSINNYSFTLVSEGKDHSPASVVLPDPELSARLYPGGSQSGWIAFLVNKNDPSPLITYGRDYDGTGGLWFQP